MQIWPRAVGIPGKNAQNPRQSILALCTELWMLSGIIYRDALAESFERIRRALVSAGPKAIKKSN